MSMAPAICTSRINFNARTWVLIGISWRGSPLNRQEDQTHSGEEKGTQAEQEDHAARP
jgi:hypothetical protein